METPGGRMGHDLGLDITEPSLLALADATVIEEGTVVSLEPSLVLPPAGGRGSQLMVPEENLVVTLAGCDC